MVVGGFRWFQVVLGGCRSFLLLVTTHLAAAFYVCCVLLRLVGSCWMKFDQFQTSSNNFQRVITTRNNTQHGVQTLATCWAQQFCVLLANNVASVCTGLHVQLLERYRARMNKFNEYWSSYSMTLNVILTLLCYLGALIFLCHEDYICREVACEEISDFKFPSEITSLLVTH